MTTRFSKQVKGCEVRYTGQSFPKDHVRGCEEAYSYIPQEQWVHKFINTLDTTPINWYLEAELRLMIEMDIGGHPPIPLGPTPLFLLVFQFS
jgi:hypothetical protein